MAWLSNWEKRIKITIDKDQIDADLSNFPIQIYLSASSGQNNDDVSAIFDELSTVSGTKKIAITTSDEETQCYVEIERWDWSNEKAWLHVKVPTIVSGTDTDLYIYYDSEEADNTSYVGDVGDTPGQTVWDSNFKAVYHLGEDPTTGSGCVLDSTSNTNHGTPGGSMTSGDLVDGQFGKALDFDGVDDEIDFGACNNIDFITNKTIESIINPDTLGEGTAGRIVRKGGGGDGWGVHLYTDNYIYYSQGASTNGWWRVSTDLNEKHLAITYNNSSVSNDPSFYIDGALQSIQNEANPAGTIADDSAYNLTLASIPTGTYCFDGIIDEVRISDTIRSGAWINATYEGLWDNLLTYGAEEEHVVFYYEGYVTVESVPVSRVVRLYKRDTGVLVNSTTSSGVNGYFKLSSGYEDYHFVVVLPDLTENYNILTDDKIHPTGGN